MCIRNLLFASILLVCVIPELNAQVFIPDTIMRSWLNSEIPGIVDVNGIMDTAHSGIANIDTALIYTYQTTWVDVDLEGIQYLDSIRRLRVTSYGATGSFHVNAWPDNLTDFQLISGCDSVILPSFPVDFSSLSINKFSSQPWYLEINALPDTLDYMSINTIEPISIVLPTSQSYVHNVIIDGYVGYQQSMVLDFHNLQIGNFSTHAAGLANFHVDGLEAERFYLIASEFDTLVFTASVIGHLDVSGCNFLLADFNGLSLQEVTMDGTWIDSLIAWPTQIRALDLDNSTVNYDRFPSLPDSLRELEITFTYADLDIASFPDSLSSIYFEHIGQNVCLPPLPGNLQSFYWDYPPYVEPCIPNYPSNPTFSYTGPTLANGQPLFCSVLNSACPGVYPGISGTNFADLNANGLQDAGEPALLQSTVDISGGVGLVGTDASGYYEIGVPPGSYLIEPTSTYPYIIGFSPSQHSANLPALGDADTLNDFGFLLIPNVSDLRANAYSQPARPGFENRVNLYYSNYGTVSTTPTVSFSFDTDQSWVGSNPAPSSLSGNVATWNLTTMQLGESGLIQVDLYTDASVPLGTPLEHTLVLDPLAPDTTPNDNIHLITDTVVGSYDPNDKLLAPSLMTPPDVQAGLTPIEYTIRFQNTGTYAAERVVIVDTLSTDLQWNTFDFVGSSHPCTWYMLDGVLHFIFDPINLPDSTSDEPNSHGNVKFRIIPSTQLQNGETVENIAHIVFDFNEAIITLPAIFTVDQSVAIEELTSETVKVYPNPAGDRLWMSTSRANGTVSNVEVLDLSGRLIKQVNNVSGGFDVEDLSAGTYLLRARVNDVEYTVPFVKR